jgi:hypothetical protein
MTATQLFVVPKSIPIILPITIKFQMNNYEILVNHHAMTLKMQKCQHLKRFQAKHRQTRLKQVDFMSVKFKEKFINCSFINGSKQPYYRRIEPADKNQ